MNPQLIIAAIIAIGGFGSAWQLQEWRYGAKESERAEQILADERLSAAAAIRRTEAVIAAQSEATIRERGLRVDAAGARTAVISLHDAAEQALRDAAASQSACIERATAIGQLLETSAGAYQSMAEVADRHASDVKTLIASWPR